MKKIICTLILAIASLANAQVIIGDAVGTATTKTSVLLEFAAGQNKGIIVPSVRTLPVGAALIGGSIILDATTATSARVKFYNGTSWIDLSGQNADLTAFLANQPTMFADPSAHAIIGDPTSTADGVLVLESTTKAMVLPTVADVLNIPSPSAGMMVYVNRTGGKRLAVFNGSKWSFLQRDVPTVASPTGKIWMDRNLGATQVATSVSDIASYGNLYQWGRITDGHQLRTSPQTTTLSTTDVPGNGNFITTSVSPNDWRSTQNNGLWQGVNGVNNPCPSGFRLPTNAELNAERVAFASQNSSGAYLSPLKLPAAGSRNSAGNLVGVGTDGNYWTSDISTTNSQNLTFNATTATNTNSVRSFGLSVRCIKN